MRDLWAQQEAMEDGDYDDEGGDEGQEDEGQEGEN